MLVSPPKPREELDLPRVYVERIAFVPPARAEAAFDLLLELHGDPSGQQRYRFETPRGEILLEGPARSEYRRGRSAVYPLRVVGGSLLTRKGLYRARVELELLRWSETASLVGLRPAAHWKHPLGYGPYFRIGGEVLTRIRDELEGWATALADTRSA